MRSTQQRAIIVVIHAIGVFLKQSALGMGKQVIQIPRGRNGAFEPQAVPKHESRGLSIEKLVILLYAKGLSVSGIEDELREIYENTLSRKCHFLLMMLLKSLYICQLEKSKSAEISL